MKTNFIALVVTFLFFTLPTYSQNKESFSKVYNTETIYQFGNKFMKGNEKLTYTDLAREFTNPRTQDLYHRSKKKLFISRIFNVASIGVIVASIFTPTTVNGSVKFAVGTALLGLGGVYYQTESSKYVQRAIWERNRDLLNASLQ